MSPITLLLLTVLACTLAAPTGSYASGKSSAYTSPVATILKQISQHNDDGSYTFGYENSDGSFRVENMDSYGYVTGKYGYIDANGQPQETEYVAGKMSGESVGYQSRSTFDSNLNRNAGPFPVLRSVQRSIEQKALDYSYSSVDDDEDGFPDNVPVRSTSYDSGVVRLTSPAYDNTQSVVRLTSPAKVSYDQSVVRIVDPVQVSQPADVRLVAPVRSTTSFTSNPSVVRLVDPYTQVSNIRTVNPTKTVRVVSSNNRGAYRPNVVRISNPTRSYEPAIRVANRGTSIYQSPSVVRQTVTPSKQVVFRSPVSVNDYQTTGSRTLATGQTLSAGPMADFLRKIETNSRSFDSGYDVIESIDSTSDLGTSFQQQIPVQTNQDDSISVEAPVFSSTV